MNITPILSRLRANRKFRARSSEIICPPEIRSEAPAIFLPDEIDRIVAVQHETSFDNEMNRIFGGNVTHQATVAHDIGKALLADGVLYHSCGRVNFQSRPRRPFLSGEIARLDRAAVVTTGVAEAHFGHWLRDSLITERLANVLGLHAIAPDRDNWKHEDGYRAITGLRSDRYSQVLIENAVIFEDIGLNTNAITRLEWIREKVRAQVDHAVGPRRVYLRRVGGGNGRDMLNEKALNQFLISKGFETIDPISCSVGDIARSLSNADIVVLSEGSAHNHALLTMKRGSALVTIQPPRRFNAVVKPFFHAVGIEWAFTVGDDDGEGFSAPFGRLMRAIDLGSGPINGIPNRYRV